MDTRQLTPEQHAALQKQIEQLESYLHRLLDRIHDHRRPNNDGEFFNRAHTAMKAVHSLWEYVAFHRPGERPKDDRLPF
jgi:hypothetical protein